MRQALAALALVFVAAHLPFLPPGLEDVDSTNFALGVRDFDVARHQPHPPGYPVYIALSKASAAAFRAVGSSRAVVGGLAVWSVASGAALVLLLFALFRALDGDDRRAWWGMAIAVACPLFWFTALRPLSDMTGLAAAVGAQALALHVVSGRAAGKEGALLIASAFVAGVAAGIRAQTVVLTAPLLAAAILLPRSGLTVRHRVSAVVSACAGALLWAVPLVAASGGLDGYLAALGTQAGEDFSGVVMLWTTRTPRAAVNAFMYTFVWPWGGMVLGGVVLAAGLVGAVRLLRDNPRAALWLAVAFAPYAAFHLLFHETATVRYALPLVVPVAFLAACAFDWAGRRPATALGVALVGVMLLAGTRAARAYGAVEPPAFRAMRAAIDAANGAPVGMHAVFRRTAEWTPPGAGVLLGPHGREWLTLVERWRTDPSTVLTFVADPRRTDLALFDARARELGGAFRWPLPELPFVGGTRPGNADWYRMRPPGWMLDRGWALSAEIGGVAARDAAGPHLQPSLAWARGREGESLLMIGGRNLDGEPTQVTLSRAESPIDSWVVRPGFFFRLIPLSAGVLDAPGYVPLSVTAGPSRARVSLEQFDLQGPGVEMVGFAEGWHEPEYNPATARAWRWMSERATLWVRPVDRELTLTIAGESPLRYFDAAPTVRVTVSGRELARWTPSDDFAHEVRLPPDLLASAAGHVVVESDKWFVPAERGESADPRHLGLRVYGVRVR